MNTRGKHLVTGVASLAAMALALAGCGAGGSSASSDSSKSGEKVEITYLHRLPDKEGMTLVDTIVKKWNDANPNIHVTATRFKGEASNMMKKLEADVKAGTAPDLAQLGYAELPEAYTKGILEDVTSEADAYKSHFSSSAFGLMQIGGKTYGLPQDGGPLVYYYNEAAFKELGIEVPQTQAELLESAQKAAAAGKYIMSFQADEAGNMLTGLAAASKPWYTVKDDKWVVDTNTDGSKAVADVYQQMIDAKSAFVNPRWEPSFDAALKDGSLIGTIGAAWEAPLIMDSAGGGESTWKVAQLGDWFGNNGKTGPDGGSGVAALKGTKHKAEAMKFLDWFNTQVEDLTSQGLIVSATTETAKTPESWSKFYGGQDVMAELVKANNNMGDFSFIPGYSAVGAAMKETAAKAADGSGKVADIFSVAQTTSIDTLKNLKLDVAE
ncbi:extracellular solute-binding protein [Alloscardovia theropitheci]|uniref:Extracellular solute-binding protein n=1 Tax=Alloscardovia theropitheci TaxID=2496842 RepID=A0A4V6N6W2_9BIFI|nr:extracellular solute-binding protein [Alloscardovia theropitheci]TCD53959.1 extracellular solute-binding protein [Alloscardovia theropitheci]